MSRGAKYLAIGTIGIWLVGPLVLAARSRDQIRQALGYPGPGATRSEFTHFGFRKFARNINPRRLNDIGRVHLDGAAKSEQLLLHWMIDGFLLFVRPVVVALSSKF